MNVNCIGTNMSFAATIKGKLKKEIDKKAASLRRAPDNKAPMPYDTFLWIKRDIIKKFPEAIVSINKEDPSKYIVEYKQKKYYIPRGNDKDFFRYDNLRTGLINLEKELKK